MMRTYSRAAKQTVSQARREKSASFGMTSDSNEFSGALAVAKSRQRGPSAA
jgi:hypothetical protein